jgi:hypothetical protein
MTRSFARHPFVRPRPPVSVPVQYAVRAFAVCVALSLIVAAVASAFPG